MTIKRISARQTDKDELAETSWESFSGVELLVFVLSRVKKNSQLERISCLWYCMVNLFFLCCAKT
jgi:hypothetical protein